MNIVKRKNMSKRVIEPTFRTVSRICENMGQSALGAFKCLSHELAATFGCLCLARTKLDNYHCVRTHCVGLTLLNCYPTFLVRKKELEQARQSYLFCVAICFVVLYALRKSENGLPQRYAVGTFDVWVWSGVTADLDPPRIWSPTPTPLPPCRKVLYFANRYSFIPLGMFR